jgi:three-Cys-motif partner protein
VLKDNDPAKWVYKEHTRVKHALLEKYLRAWIPILGSTNPRIMYVDGFAGRGVYEDGSPGSPVLAMKLADEFAPRLQNITLRLVERNEENYENLKSAVEAQMPKLLCPDRVLVHHSRGDFDEAVCSLLDHAESSGVPLGPSFVFIDPFGFTGVPLQTVGRILALPKTEVFFTFMLRDVNRFLELDQIAPAVDGLFGGDCWREVTANRDRERALVELYRKRLHEGANARYSLHFKVCESDSTATLYYLVHANNNFKGHQIMKGVMLSQGVNGEFAYLGTNDLAERTQTLLFDPNDTSGLEAELMRRYAGQTITFDGIMEAMCHPWNLEPPFIERHYRKVIKQMASDGSVCIRRISSKRSGLKENDLVVFAPRKQ